jgi:hypothetical protein
MILDISLFLGKAAVAEGDKAGRNSRRTAAIRNIPEKKAGETITVIKNPQALKFCNFTVKMVRGRH